MAPKKADTKKASKKKEESTAKRAKKEEADPADVEAAPAQEPEKLALQKQFNSACKYLSSKDTPEQIEAKRQALQTYLAGRPEVKAEALEQFARDKSLKWAGNWVRKIKEETCTKDTSVRGWMLPEEIMELKKVNKQNPQYDALWSALKGTLVEREHDEPSWAALGLKQYYYAHQEHQKVEVSSSSSTTMEGKAAGKGHVRLLHDGGADAANIVVQHPEWQECNAKYKIHKSGTDKLSQVAKEVSKMLAQYRVGGPEHADDVAQLSSLLREIHQFQEDMDVQSATFASCSKIDVTALAALSISFDDCKKICEAFSKTCFY